MWKHKQEARELHHESGNITKKQQAVRRTLQDYENSMEYKCVFVHIESCCKMAQLLLMTIENII